LTEEELDTALKDLDLNGDGVIDLKEFSRWWFTGKKEFNGSRRAVL
jgi:Ca2+-binding EF-hand superfamily protein